MPTVRLPKRQPRALVANAILDAAAALFSSRGYEATTMQDVAGAVGMTAPALYYHFDSKQRLLFEVIDVNFRDFNAEMDAAIASESTPRRQLEALVRGQVRFQLQRAAAARLYNAMFLGTSALYNALTSRHRARIRAMQDESARRLDALLDRGARAGEFSLGDRAVVSHALMAMGEQAAAWYRPGGSLTIDHVADEIAALALRLVGAVPAPAAHARRPRPRPSRR